jgi:hypothetical protein
LLRSPARSSVARFVEAYCASLSSQRGFCDRSL